MTKEEFLSAVSARLTGLPPEDITRSLDYYREMMADRMEDGLDEEQAVAAMGSAEEAAEQIMLDMPLQTIVKARVKPSRTLRAWEIVLLILGSPVWLPLCLAAVIVVLAVYIVIWAVIASLYAADISVFAGGLAGAVCAVFFLCTGYFPQALMLLGAGLICTGVAVLLLLGFNQVTRGAVFISKKALLFIKSLFIRKGTAK